MKCHPNSLSSHKCHKESLESRLNGSLGILKVADQCNLSQDVFQLALRLLECVTIDCGKLDGIGGGRKNNQGNHHKDEQLQDRNHRPHKRDSYILVYETQGIPQKHNDLIRTRKNDLVQPIEDVQVAREISKENVCHNVPSIKSSHLASLKGQQSAQNIGIKSHNDSSKNISLRSHNNNLSIRSPPSTTTTNTNNLPLSSHNTTIKNIKSHMATLTTTTTTTTTTSTMTTLQNIAAKNTISTMTLKKVGENMVGKNNTNINTNSNIINTNNNTIKNSSKHTSPNPIKLTSKIHSKSKPTFNTNIISRKNKIDTNTHKTVINSHKNVLNINSKPIPTNKHSTMKLQDCQNHLKYISIVNKNIDLIKTSDMYAKRQSYEHYQVNITAKKVIDGRQEEQQGGINNRLGSRMVRINNRNSIKSSSLSSNTCSIENLVNPTTIITKQTIRNPTKYDPLICLHLSTLFLQPSKSINLIPHLYNLPKHQIDQLSIRLLIEQLGGTVRRDTVWEIYREYCCLWTGWVEGERGQNISSHNNQSKNIQLNRKQKQHPRSSLNLQKFIQFLPQTSRHPPLPTQSTLPTPSLSLLINLISMDPHSHSLCRHKLALACLYIGIKINMEEEMYLRGDLDCLDKRGNGSENWRGNSKSKSSDSHINHQEQLDSQQQQLNHKWLQKQNQQYYQGQTKQEQQQQQQSQRDVCPKNRKQSYSTNTNQRNSHANTKSNISSQLKINNHTLKSKSNHFQQQQIINNKKNIINSNINQKQHQRYYSQNDSSLINGKKNRKIKCSNNNNISSNNINTQKHKHMKHSTAPIITPNYRQSSTVPLYSLYEKSQSQSSVTLNKQQQQQQQQLYQHNSQYSQQQQQQSSQISLQSHHSPLFPHFSNLFHSKPTPIFTDPYNINLHFSHFLLKYMGYDLSQLIGYIRYVGQMCGGVGGEVEEWLRGRL